MKFQPIPFHVKGKYALQDEQKQKILIAVDGSKQALNAVRYVASIMDPPTTIVVLLNIENETPSWIKEVENNPLFRTEMAGAKQWSLNRKKIIRQFFDDAKQILSDAGFPLDNVRPTIHLKKVGIASDILEESKNGYSAVVMGRSGISKIKDLLFDSFAQNLIGKIKNIPLIIVGGEKFSRNIMIAYDPAVWTQMNVNCVGSLLKASACTFRICHAVQSETIDQDRISRSMEEARDMLKRFGKPDTCVTSEVISIEKGPAIDIIEAALKGNYDTVVVGRRGFRSYYEEQFVGRFSKKILKKSNKMAVWILS
jgi:nucleotide-binding universal stress UspA family protein